MRLLRLWALFGWVCTALLAPALAQTRVHVQQGTLEGSVSGDVVSFKGVPFAAPPVGDLRWRPPQPANASDGVRQARSFPAACKQVLVRSLLPWTEEFMHPREDSEDCLYLNVWAPRSVAKGRPLPVYVFIHGGAFTGGSTAVPVYDGAALAAKGVEVVTIQYRLGVFGFFAHPALTAESPEHASGDYGLLDCIAALRWVKENIAAFGGDPSRVTVGGQSAGAAALHDLLASPLSRGLIEGVIAESGSSVGSGMKSLSAAEKDGEAFAAAKGAMSLAALRALPADKLLPEASGPAAMRFSPVIDGWCLPEDPTAAIADGHVLDVPILTGMQADEGSSSKGYGHSSAPELDEQTAMTYGKEAQARFRVLYPFSDQDSASAMSKAAARDRGLASLYLWASRTAAGEHRQVYTYYWTHVLPWPQHPEFGSFHSSELPYVFDHLSVLHRPFTDADRALAAEASGWWVNFIRNGDPNGRGSPHWDRFDAARPETMEIDVHAHMRPLMSPARLEFWTSVRSPAESRNSATHSRAN